MEQIERIFLAVDVSNMWKSCREEFGETARVDFKVLGEYIPSLRHPTEVHQKLVAYVITNPSQKHHALAQVLRSYGYTICERYMRHEKGLVKPLHTDWDVGITIDAIEMLHTYDTFVLASGDGDFVLLLDYLKSKGKKTIVLSFERATAKALYGCADELHTFKDNIVFKPLSTRMEPHGT